LAKEDVRKELAESEGSNDLFGYKMAGRRKLTDYVPWTGRLAMKKRKLEKTTKEGKGE